LSLNYLVRLVLNFLLDIRPFDLTEVFPFYYYSFCPFYSLASFQHSAGSLLVFIKTKYFRKFLLVTQVYRT
jgi:hypothetical protein